MFAKARDFTSDVFRRIGRRIFHHDSSEDKQKKSKHSDGEILIENGKRDVEENSVTRSGDAAVVKVVVTAEPESQAKESDNSGTEYKEVSTPELMETNIDATSTSEDVKPKHSTQLDSITVITDQQPTSTVDVLYPIEQVQECGVNENTKVDNDVKEVVAETVIPIDMVEGSVPESDSSAPEVEDLIIETSEKPANSETEVLIESVSIPKPEPQVTVEADYEIKLDEVIEDDVQVTENVETPLVEADSAEPIQFESDEKIEVPSAPPPQLDGKKSSDERVEDEASMEPNGALQQTQPAAEVAESSQDVAVDEQETDEDLESLKPQKMEKTQDEDELEIEEIVKYLDLVECPQNKVDESDEIIAVEANVEISEYAEGVSAEAISGKIEESHSNQPKEEIQLAEDVSKEVTTDVEVKKSADEPSEQLTAFESVSVTEQKISKGNEKVTAMEALQTEEGGDIEQTKDNEKVENSSLEVNVESEEMSSESQEVEIQEAESEEAGELQQESDTVAEFETMQIYEKPVEVAEESTERQEASESKQNEASEIQHESELKSAEKFIESETNPSMISEEVKDEIQRMDVKQSEDVVEPETKLSEKMSPESEKQEEAVEIQQESEDAETEVSEGIVDVKIQQEESFLNEEKTDEVENGLKEQSHEGTVVPVAKYLVEIPVESEMEKKSESMQEDTDEPQREFEEISHEESVKSEPTRIKIEEIVDSEAEEIPSEEKTLVESFNGLDHEIESEEVEQQKSSELKKEDEAGDIQQEDEIASNAESVESQTGTEEGTEGEGSEQLDGNKSHRKRRRKPGKGRRGKGKH